MLLIAVKLIVLILRTSNNNDNTNNNNDSSNTNSDSHKFVNSEAGRWLSQVGRCNNNISFIAIVITIYPSIVIIITILGGGQVAFAPRGAAVCASRCPQS